MKLSLNDKKLFQRIKNDDFIAFESIFKKYYKNLCVFAEHYVGETEMAKEIVGDFFLKLWEDRKKIQINNSCKNYLFTSIQNSCLKYLEHLKVLNKYRAYSKQRLKNIEFLNSVSGDYPLANLISQEIVEEIENAIESLPEKCKEIFKLSRFENLSYDEISVKLDVSINTVRTQMSRALEKLRYGLSDYLPLIFIGILCHIINLISL